MHCLMKILKVVETPIPASCDVHTVPKRAHYPDRRETAEQVE